MKLLRMPSRPRPCGLSRRLLVVVGALLVTTVVGCSETVDDEPAPSMSKAEVWRQINDNMATVDVEFTPIEDTLANANLVARYGCATSRRTMMPAGPPWRYQIVEVNHPIGDYARLIAGLEALREVGFEVPQVYPADAPHDVRATDPRGFTVSISVDDARPGAEPTVDVSSDSPCVRHPATDAGR